MFVVLESPFKTGTILLADGKSIVLEEKDNIEYARACMKDCLDRGEAVLASHLLYTQSGVLDDSVPAERKRGIEAGLEVAKKADMRVFYLDRGLSAGMKLGIEAARELDQVCEMRLLGGIWNIGWCAEVPLRTLVDGLR